MPAVHPHERDRRADEVEQHVREAEQRGCEGDRLERALDAALDVDPDLLLEGHDVGRVPEGRLDVLAARAADDLVEAVERGEAGDLASTGVGIREPGANHGPSLPPAARPHHAAPSPPAVRKAAPLAVEAVPSTDARRPATAAVAFRSAARVSGAGKGPKVERTHAFEQRVVGREQELAALAACVSGGTAPGGAAVVVGEPGIGKTTLWEAAVEMARAQGLRTLLARPTDAEARLAHGTLVDLFDGVAPHELAGLLPPQRRALEVALLRAEPDGRAPEAGAVPVGLLNALRLLAARTPLVIGIDDLQSLDAQSAEALAFAARRLDSAPVRFVLARRPGRPGLLEAALASHGLAEVVVGPLSLGATRRLVSLRLGLSLPRHVLRRRPRSDARQPAVRPRARTVARGARPARARRRHPAAGERRGPDRDECRRPRARRPSTAARRGARSVPPRRPAHGRRRRGRPRGGALVGRAPPGRGSSARVPSAARRRRDQTGERHGEEGDASCAREARHRREPARPPSRPRDVRPRRGAGGDGRGRGGHGVGTRRRPRGRDARRARAPPHAARVGPPAREALRVRGAVGHRRRAGTPHGTAPAGARCAPSGPGACPGPSSPERRRGHGPRDAEPPRASARFHGRGQGATRDRAGEACGHHGLHTRRADRRGGEVGARGTRGCAGRRARGRALGPRGSRLGTRARGARDRRSRGAVRSCVGIGLPPRRLAPSRPGSAPRLAGRDERCPGGARADDRALRGARRAVVHRRTPAQPLRSRDALR